MLGEAAPLSRLARRHRPRPPKPRHVVRQLLARPAHEGLARRRHAVGRTRGSRCLASPHGGTTSIGAVGVPQVVGVHHPRDVVARVVHKPKPTSPRHWPSRSDPSLPIRRGGAIGANATKRSRKFERTSSGTSKCSTTEIVDMNTSARFRRSSSNGRNW